LTQKQLQGLKSISLLLSGLTAPATCIPAAARAARLLLLLLALFLALLLEQSVPTGQNVIAIIQIFSGVL